jgi:flagellar motor protein MotB
MKNPVLFMGLFLITFGLFAKERMRPHTVSVSEGVQASSLNVVDVPDSKTPAVIEGRDSNTPSRGSNLKVQALFQNFMSDALLASKADGMRLAREPNAMMVQLYGEDVFADGATDVHESWYPVLDRIAAKLTADEFKKGLRVEIRGFADEASPREQKPSDFGRSDFAFSFARAEWLARYFERKWRIPLQEAFTLKGMGARPYGKKLEIWLSY